MASGLFAVSSHSHFTLKIEPLEPIFILGMAQAGTGAFKTAISVAVASAVDPARSRLVSPKLRTAPVSNADDDLVIRGALFKRKDFIGVEEEGLSCLLSTMRSLFCLWLARCSISDLSAEWAGLGGLRSIWHARLLALFLISLSLNALCPTRRCISHVLVARSDRNAPHLSAKLHPDRTYYFRNPDVDAIIEQCNRKVRRLACSA